MRGTGDDRGVVSRLQSDSDDSWSDRNRPDRIRITGLKPWEASKLFARRRRPAAADCTHAKTITIRNSGIERTVCEECGYVSFRAQEGLSGNASRTQFERESERTQSTVG